MTNLALDSKDLTPVGQIDLTGPFIAVLAACLLLAAALIACVVVLSRPKRAKPKAVARGAHRAMGDKAYWRGRIDEVTARHADGSLDREEAFAELAAIARDFASDATGRDMKSHTLTDIRREPRNPATRQGLDLLRMTVAALYPPEFADMTVDAHARGVTVEEAAGWVSNLVERWGR
ncbi:hypothetical protein [Bifidobacterium platyrrhinorum]|uniref:Uncharacterized protein n=1 Tax=Bifidobacterium platyrrhinorum TaxID=2661628 RepID=A0A6L9SQP2_9BIFI|nr:hypothetical protein [Bifidobacterium platyrrhinorum]NEG54319.1 hypothetical protein [Bifidobacterium platyrrhinorum]